MAQEVLLKQEQLDCSVCLDSYTDPKQLRCSHVFCQNCLVKLVDRDQQGQLVLPCPTCRQTTPVPANGVTGIQSALRVDMHLREMIEKYDRTVRDQRIGAEEGERDSNIPCKKRIDACREHEGIKAELYCKTCQEFVCLRCVVRSGSHYSHDSELIHEAFDRCVGEIKSSLEPVEEWLADLKGAVGDLEARCGEIFLQSEAIEASIQDTFRRLQALLDARKIELIDWLHQITQGKLKALAVQKDQIEATQAQLSSCMDFVKDKLKPESGAEVLLMMKTTIVQQVNELTTTFQSDLLKPSTEADMVLSASEEFARECQNYGHVAVSSSLELSQCYATGKGLETAVVGEKSTAILQAINFKGQPCTEAIDSPECELVSEMTGTRVRGGVKRRGESQYEVGYRPTVKGRHQLHIRVEGRHIRGSPFSIAVTSPVKKLGAPIMSVVGLKEPRGVAINQRREKIVAGSHSVTVLSLAGEKLISFGTRGSDLGQFQHPYGVAVDTEGNILVVDCWNHRIQKFTSEGRFLAAVGTRGKDPLQFMHPKGIAVDFSSGNIYIAECNHRIQVLNSDLTFSGTFGKRGSGKGQFNFPLGMACDHNGKVYVADSENNRIQVFTAEGRFVRAFSKRGEPRSALDKPVGIAVDPRGVIYVCEGDVQRISVFTSEGQFLTSLPPSAGGGGVGWGEVGKGEAGLRGTSFKELTGLAVDGDGVVCVCDSGANCLHVF